MTYEELIAKALKKRSARAFAAEHGITNGTMHRIAAGTHLPDYRTAALLAAEARVSLGEVTAILVAKEQELKGTKEAFTAGFRYLTNTLNRLFTRVSAV